MFAKRLMAIVVVLGLMASLALIPRHAKADVESDPLARERSIGYKYSIDVTPGDQSLLWGQQATFKVHITPLYAGEPIAGTEVHLIARHPVAMYGDTYEWDSAYKPVDANGDVTFTHRFYVVTFFNVEASIDAPDFATSGQELGAASASLEVNLPHWLNVFLLVTLFVAVVAMLSVTVIFFKRLLF